MSSMDTVRPERRWMGMGGNDNIAEIPGITM